MLRFPTRDELILGAVGLLAVLALLIFGGSCFGEDEE